MRNDGFSDILLSMIDELSVSGLQMLRVFRTARLARAARILQVIPELNAMVRGFISAMSAMLWGFVMILILLMFWAVLAVELLNHASKEVYGDDTCSKAFAGVWPALQMFFQTLVAGDGWGGCSIGLINHPSYGAPAVFIFAGSLVTIQLGFTNLILAATFLVDSSER